MVIPSGKYYMRSRVTSKAARKLLTVSYYCSRSLCLTDDSISALGTTIASPTRRAGEAMESDLTVAVVLSAMLIVVSLIVARAKQFVAVAAKMLYILAI